jgi:3-phytase
MHRQVAYFSLLSIAFLNFSCGNQSQETSQMEPADSTSAIRPIYITDSVVHDTDDPAIWINKVDPSKSLILGTDKDQDGSLYVFDLKGKKIDSLHVGKIQRPNNVDVGYGLVLGNDTLDFAVTGERFTSRLRFFSLPDMKELNAPGIEVYVGETGPEYKDLMGVAIYQNPTTGKHYVIAGRKNGPVDGSYLWQYELKDQNGTLGLELVRKFGNYSGTKEIEAIAVDAELGYIYYSDEQAGIRKYHSDPSMGNGELAFFGQSGFADDHEGISIYNTEDGKGYVLISDQGANIFQVFPREGGSDNPHRHDLIAKIPLSTLSSDGSEVTNIALGPDFPKGLFVAMSEDKTFQIYRWEELANYIKTKQN